jgi:hypothetical protein
LIRNLSRILLAASVVGFAGTASALPGSPPSRADLSSRYSNQALAGRHLAAYGYRPEGPATDPYIRLWDRRIRDFNYVAYREEGPATSPFIRLWDRRIDEFNY